MRSAGKRAVAQADVRVKCAGERTGVRGGRIRVNVRVCQWGVRVNVRVREWLHECFPVLVHFHKYFEEYGIKCSHVQIEGHISENIYNSRKSEG